MKSSTTSSATDQHCGACLRFVPIIEDVGKCRKLGVERSKSDPACERFIGDIRIERKGKTFILTAGCEQLEYDLFNDIDSVQVGKQLCVEPKEVLKAVAQFPEEQILEKRVPEDYFDEDGKRFIPKLLADDIMNVEHFITLIGSKEIYVWKDGYYQPIGEVVIEQYCKDLLEEEFRKNRFGEVAEFIRASTFTNPEEPSGNLINVENGVLNIETGLLGPHDPKYCFFNKLNVKYDPTCKGERVHSFLKEVTNSEEDAKVLGEVIGYCLYRGYPYHKALALVGEGANGKSTFLALVKALLGQTNVSGKGLVDLELNRFAKASLFGKLANIYADLSDDTLQRTGTFKMLTGGDVIEAEKKFRDSFTFVNYAKLLFSCNKLPQVYDDTDAFFRRWIIVVFPNVFKGKNCDPNILEKLTIPEELSGLLNIALERLKRVLENEGFSYSKSTEDIREDYIRKSDPLAAFVMDCLEESQDSILLKQELYSLFAFYCRENNLPAVNKDTFFKNISKHVTVTQVRINRKDVPGRPYGFMGITLTELGEELWSKQSNQSGVSDILIEREEGDSGHIKIGKTIDSLDWSDHKSNSVTKIDIQNILSISALDPVTRGDCPICKKKDVSLVWQVLMLNDSRYDAVCMDCGGNLQEELRSVTKHE